MRLRPDRGPRQRSSRGNVADSPRQNADFPCFVSNRERHWWCSRHPAPCRACRASTLRTRSHRNQQWSPSIVELPAGLALQKRDASIERVVELVPGIVVTADDRRAKRDRQHERRRHRNAVRRHPREIGGFGANLRRGTRLFGVTADQDDIHGQTPLKLTNPQAPAREADGRSRPADRSPAPGCARGRAPRAMS